jgi:hypothetical protein
MRTTSLLVDLLIIGLLPFIWVSCLLFAFIFPVSALNDICSEISILSSFLVIAIIYVIGNIVDYTNAYLFSLWPLKIEKKLSKKISVIRILARNPELHRYLDSHYSRLRITKAAILNIIPISVGISILIYQGKIPVLNTDCISIYIFTLNLISMAILWLSICSYKKRMITYWKYLHHAQKEIKH